MYKEAHFNSLCLSPLLSCIFLKPKQVIKSASIGWDFVCTFISVLFVLTFLHQYLCLRNYRQIRQTESYLAPDSNYLGPSSSYEGPGSDYQAPDRQGSYQHPGSRQQSGRRKTLNTGYQAPRGDYSAPSSDYSAPSSDYSARSSYTSPGVGYSAPGEDYASPPASDYSAQAEYQGRESVTNQKRIRPGSTDQKSHAFYEAPSSGVLSFFEQKGNFIF